MIFPFLILRITAHSGEVHQSRLASQIHAFPWYIQVLLFLCIVGVIFSLAWLVTRKLPTAMLATSCALLVIGFGSYQLSPIVSVLSITIGLAATLFLTLIGDSKR